MDTVLPPFTVTQAAIDRIASLGGAVLIDVAEGGCCGTAYTFTAVTGDSLSENADRYGCPGAWLFVTAGARGLLPGAVLDHSDRIRPPRFRVLRNPNTPQTCPCRRSFGAPWPGAGCATCQSYAPMPWDLDFDPPPRWQRQTGWTRPDGAAAGSA